MDIQKVKIAIIGLGYVGLPLAVEFSKKYRVIGYDINTERISQLLQANDNTLEISNNTLEEVLILESEFDSNIGLSVTNNNESIKDCNVYIVTVPTPTDKYNRPVLEPLLNASKLISNYLNKNNVVIYESTVYPGVTEEECVKVLQEGSNLKLNIDFFVGYSPERINPGDKIHTVTKILKITSGSTPEAADFIDLLYRSIIIAGTFKASSIKVAEAAKVIENTQRDINIAFVNELSKIFNLLEIDTNEVLLAASTKWNFLNFKPGLVGGHCIGVDPYYLAQKAQEVGYHPEIILAGRRINDGMGKYVAHETVKLMLKKGIKIVKSKALILGFSFKENCPDYRNTRVIDIYNELKSYDIDVDIYDPWVNVDNVQKELNLNIISNKININLLNYSAIILAVAHDEFLNFDLQKVDNRVIYDVKGIMDKNLIDARL